MPPGCIPRYLPFEDDLPVVSNDDSRETPDRYIVKPAAAAPAKSRPKTKLIKTRTPRTRNVVPDQMKNVPQVEEQLDVILDDDEEKEDASEASEVKPKAVEAPEAASVDLLAMFTNADTVFNNDDKKRAAVEDKAIAIQEWPPKKKAKTCVRFKTRVFSNSSQVEEGDPEVETHPVPALLTTKALRALAFAGPTWSRHQVIKNRHGSEDEDEQSVHPDCDYEFSTTGQGLQAVPKESKWGPDHNPDEDTEGENEVVYAFGNEADSDSADEYHPENYADDEDTDLESDEVEDENPVQDAPPQNPVPVIAVRNQLSCRASASPNISSAEEEDIALEVDTGEECDKSDEESNASSLSFYDADGEESDFDFKEPRNKKTAKKQHISIQVVKYGSKTIVSLKVTPRSKVRDVERAFRGRTEAKASDSLSFSFDGNDLQPEKTMASLGVKERDVLFVQVEQKKRSNGKGKRGSAKQKKRSNGKGKRGSAKAKRSIVKKEYHKKMEDDPGTSVAAKSVFETGGRGLGVEVKLKLLEIIGGIGGISEIDTGAHTVCRICDKDTAYWGFRGDPVRDVISRTVTYWKRLRENKFEEMCCKLRKKAVLAHSTQQH